LKITTSKTELTTQDISEIISVHGADARRKLNLKDYYLGRHKILNKAGRENTNVNNKLVNNYCAYISNISTNFFIGQPVTYKTFSENQPALDSLLEIFKYNDEQAHNLNLAEESSITGTSFEILYLDGDAQIRFSTVPSEEIILVCDSTLEENILYAIRHYRIYGFNFVSYDEYVDVYDRRNVNHYSYSGGNLKLLNATPHFFDDVPVVEYPNNRQRRGDFEDVLSLVDAYNLAQSLTADDLADFTDAFLLIKGLHIGGDDAAKDLRRRKIIELEDSGDARWLIKDLNDTYVENFKNRLQKDIHKFSNIPGMSDDYFSGNTSGVAIKYKLIGLEQIRSRKEREFKKALQRRIELISGILTLKSLPPVDFRDIDIQFTANIPANTAELAQIVTSLDGIVSQKTLLGLLPFVTDAAEELDELKLESGENE